MFTYSLSWQSTRTFKPQTKAISALGIVLFSQMASAEIALVCGLKVRVDCQDRLCVNIDADEIPAQWNRKAD